MLRNACHSKYSKHFDHFFWLTKVTSRGGGRLGGAGGRCIFWAGQRLYKSRRYKPHNRPACCESGKVLWVNVRPLEHSHASPRKTSHGANYSLFWLQTYLLSSKKLHFTRRWLTIVLTIVNVLTIVWLPGWEFMGYFEVSRMMEMY